MQVVSFESYTRRQGAMPGTTLADDIAYFARVSNPGSQISAVNNEKLINYLIKHRHWSPFEMANVCLKIDTTRDIARQMLRHRSFSFQEFSQRYAATETNSEVRETRLQDLTNRQSSIETDDRELVSWWHAAQSDLIDKMFGIYDEALKKGIAKEQARAILPEGLTQTRLFANGTLRSWIHYVALRTGKETQKEHRLLAQACAVEIAKVFPMINQFVQIES